MESPARYDGVAEWYDRDFLTEYRAAAGRDALLRLLGDAPGALLDVGCGTGFYTAALAERGWTAIGVDLSQDMLRLARERGVNVVRADATALPFGDGSFDAVVSTWTHTDVDDFAAVVREIARVLRRGGPFVYVGAHPCFVGPHSRFRAAEGVPELHRGYRQAGRYTEAPGISPIGLRAKVGATHLPLDAFLRAFLEPELQLEQFEELETREYPYMVALRCRR